MTDKKKTTTYIQTSEHAIIGHSGSPSERLEPGERVVFDANADSHKFLREQIESGNPDYAHLSIVEIDRKAEKDAAEEREELLAKAEKIAAEQRQDEAQEAADRATPPEPLEGQPEVNRGTDYPPQDVEAQRLAERSGAGQRASTQADVEEESSSSRSGRRSGSSKKG